MSFCDNCGTHLKERSKFCPNCGTRLSEVKLVIVPDVYSSQCCNCGAIITVVNPKPGKVPSGVKTDSAPGGFGFEKRTEMPCPDCNKKIYVKWSY